MDDSYLPQWLDAAKRRLGIDDDTPGSPSDILKRRYGLPPDVSRPELVKVILGSERVPRIKSDDQCWVCNATTGALARARSGHRLPAWLCIPCYIAIPVRDCDARIPPHLFRERAPIVKRFGCATRQNPGGWSTAEWIVLQAEAAARRVSVHKETWAVKELVHFLANVP